MIIWDKTRPLLSLQQTLTAEAQETLDEMSRLTSTAQEQSRLDVTATAQSQATVDAQAAAMATALAATATALAAPTATPQSLEEIVKNIRDNGTIVMGPVDGGLPHNAKDSLISVYQASVDLQDFVMEVNFFNPYNTRKGTWDYGVLFRHAGNNQHLRLAIRSDQRWVLMNNTGDPDGVVIQDGDLSNLNTNVGGINSLRLICLGTKGLFYLNDSLIAELDLSERTNLGDIYLATGIYLDDEIDGFSTDFSQLIVWSIP